MTIHIDPLDRILIGMKQSWGVRNGKDTPGCKSRIVATCQKRHTVGRGKATPFTCIRVPNDMEIYRYQITYWDKVSCWGTSPHLKCYFRNEFPHEVASPFSFLTRVIWSTPTQRISARCLRNNFPSVRKRICVSTHPKTATGTVYKKWLLNNKHTSQFHWRWRLFVDSA